MTETTAFDESRHEYRIGGRRVPSVTQIISAVIPRRFSPDAWYLERGRALHAAIHLLESGQLDWSSVDPSISGRLDAFRAFADENNAVGLASEVQIFSKRLGFAGTLDAKIAIDCGCVLADFKSSIEPSVRLQLGAYSILWKEKWGAGPARALALELKENGRYNCLWLDRRELSVAEQQFKASLTVYNFMQEHKITGRNEA